MSKFNDTSDTLGYKCPYCGYQYEADSDDYGDDGTVIDCEGCGKKFYGSANHYCIFDASPDCELNNENHNLEVPSGTKYRAANFRFCTICGKPVITPNGN